LGFVLAGCVIAAGSAFLPFIPDDDPFYAQVAKNVLATGDWITLRHQAYAQVDRFLGCATAQ
jgi:4-amino-4-deoxy-L-arabinose transferase-like glycosyltransferase